MSPPSGATQIYEWCLCCDGGEDLPDLCPCHQTVVVQRFPNTLPGPVRPGHECAEPWVAEIGKNDPAQPNYDNWTPEEAA